MGTLIETRTMRESIFSKEGSKLSNSRIGGDFKE
ncbi:hypothetical protein F383_30617 [Gossypium arboreum]|uniref:Uncharacterized protein n=1 Tax=Gossypium arboreum TaxID=29729 RepID=A0A0B0PMA3_GOSAR|nr:hypothetical protein F383_30617 [Gossypium arboreum]